MPGCPELGTPLVALFLASLSDVRKVRPDRLGHIFLQNQAVIEYGSVHDGRAIASLLL